MILLLHKKPILEIFLSNIKSLLNNLKKIKILETEINVKNSQYDMLLKLKINIEFDPWTLFVVYGKVTDLLQNMISESLS